MPIHLLKIRDTQANIDAIDSGNTAIEGQFYQTTDTLRVYLGQSDGSLMLLEGFHADGDVLYVSKEGDNLTATKGDMHDPWADPWTAAAAMSNGDVMVIMPGTWTFGPSGSGADYIITNAEDANLFGSTLTNITIYAMPGVELQKIGAFTAHSTPGTPTGLFSATLAGNFRVFGHGVYKWETTNGLGQLSSVLHVDNGGANVVFHAEEVRAGGWLIPLYEIGDIDIVLNKYRAGAVGSYGGISFRQPSLTQSNKSVCVHIKDYTNRNLTNGDSDFSGLISTRATSGIGFQDSNFTFRIDKADKLGPLDQANANAGIDVGQIFGLVHNIVLTGCVINTTIGTILYEDSGLNGTQGGNTDAYPGNGAGTYINKTAISIGAADLRDSLHHIKVGSCVSDFSCVNVNFQNGTTTAPSTVIIEGNFLSRTDYCVLLDDGSTGNASLRKIIFKGSYKSKTLSAVGDRRNNNNWPKIKFMNAHLETEAAGMEVVGLIRGGVQFENVTLVNDGSTNDIGTISGAAFDVFCMNVSSNGTGSDANINERGMPIIRNSNVF
jgi:hypothetical protein